jgi:hypothetical protein
MEKELERFHLASYSETWERRGVVNRDGPVISLTTNLREGEEWISSAPECTSESSLFPRESLPVGGTDELDVKVS